MRNSTEHSISFTLPKRVTALMPFSFPRSAWERTVDALRPYGTIMAQKIVAPFPRSAWERGNVEFSNSRDLHPVRLQSHVCNARMRLKPHLQLLVIRQSVARSGPNDDQGMSFNRKPITVNCKRFFNNGT